MPKAFKRNHEQVAKMLRNNRTEQEKKLWYTFLSKMPVRVRQQVNIGDYVVDFCCEKAKLIIEIDGSQHYECKAIEENDQTRTARLNLIGYQVLRFTNRQIDTDYKNVCFIIESTILQRLSVKTWEEWEQKTDNSVE